METYEEILSDLEKQEIVNFNNRPVMREAVRKVILACIYDQGTLRPGKPAADPKRNFAMLYVGNNYKATDEEIGRQARSAIEGAMLLELGFNKLSEIKEDKPEDKKEEVNPAQ